MVIALIAFVIGAGIGVSLSIDFDDHSDDGPKYKNVTKKMLNKEKPKDKIKYDVDDEKFVQKKLSKSKNVYTTDYD